MKVLVDGEGRWIVVVMTVVVGMDGCFFRLLVCIYVAFLNERGEARYGFVFIVRNNGIYG